MVDIGIENEVSQPDFTDINKESEDLLLGEVPPIEDLPPTDTTDIDTERESPRPEKIPPPDTDIFFEGEEAPLIMKINKRKRDAKVPVPFKRSRSRRRMEPSKYVVTPYTKGKKEKKKVKGEGEEAGCQRKTNFRGTGNYKSGGKGGRVGRGKENRITAC
ncbi:uncharacterized protein A4U43_C05F15600 [Asparagus officinalis]|uniref:Uncharacterized protein n=1 Tax=Asparagus officinalis TaxID=4686 RepID=A0A5P1ESH6_ASPOF|nr:uncharacterized protein A4U43_C05F15600 [Asparagus officinalis]